MVVTVFFGAIIALVITILLYAVPVSQTRHISDPFQRTQQENEARRTLAQIFGGLVLVIGLSFTWRQLSISHQTLLTTQQGQITERFTRAVEQLASEGAPVQLGSVYALARIAQDSNRDAAAVELVLASHLRDHARPSPPQDRTSGSAASSPSPAFSESRLVMQTIIDLLDRNDFPITNRTLDLSGIDLRGVNFRGKSFARADFSGSNLEGVSLTKANLTEVVFSSTNLADADLAGANLIRADLRFATLIRTRLEGAQLVDADLHAAFVEGADLRDADLRGVRLSGSHFEYADLRHAMLANLRAWDEMHGMALANLFGVRMPPPGFLAHAQGELSAVSLESSDEWNNQLEASSRYQGFLEEPPIPPSVRRPRW